MRLRTVVAWGIVLAAVVGAYVVQQKYGRPAMQMDMMVRGGADATVPVTVARAEMGPLAGMATYAGTVAAYAEEDVYPRVTGRIVAMTVYPGDRVEAGQVVARLDDVELGSKVREAGAAVAGAEANLAQMEADVVAAHHGVGQMEREVAMTEADLAAARHGVGQMEREVAMTEADLVATGHEVHHMGREVAMAEADLVAARHGIGQMERELATTEVEVAYQQAVAARDERLFAKGAVSRQDAESSQAMGAAARPKVEAGRSKVDQARAMAVAGQAKVDAARAKLEQAKAMIVAGQARVDAARAKVEQARAMAVSASKKREAMGAMADQSRAMLRTAEVVRDYVRIEAASSGYVAKRLVAPGTLVQPGMAILKIAQIDRVRFQANVAERDVARLRVGSPVRVQAPGRDGPPLALRVTAIFPFAEGSSRTAVVEAVAENPARRFLPGQYVTMAFELGDRVDMVTVPRGAVQRVGEHAYVWTQTDGAASRRPVKVGPADPDRVGIVDGLSAGQVVVVSGHENLYEGAKVAAADGRPGATDAMPRAAGAPDSKGMLAQQAPAAAGQARIELATTPKAPVVGKNTFVITVRDASGTPVPDATVKVTYGMPPMPGMPKGMKLDAEAKHRANGEYEAEAQLAMAGPWEVTVVVTRSGASFGTGTFKLTPK